MQGLYILNESDKDFEITKYFGPPTEVKEYYNAITNAHVMGDFRREGFWTNFRQYVPQQVKLTAYLREIKGSDAEISKHKSD